MKPDAFVASLDDERIVAAIHEAEARSRGEIRVHVAEREVTDPRAEAAVVFERLGMADTAGAQRRPAVRGSREPVDHRHR